MEVTNALDTDSFTHALRRFIARRASVRLIRSDNDTNFIGAANDLRKTLDEMNHEQVKHYLQKNGVIGSLGKIIHLLLHIGRNFGVPNSNQTAHSRDNQ